MEHRGSLLLEELCEGAQRLAEMVQRSAVQERRQLFRARELTALLLHSSKERVVRRLVVKQ